MASYKVLYWQEIPSQVKAEDTDGEVDVQLDGRFMEMIDAVATERGLVGSDDYLEGWQWSESQERSGSAAEVAKTVKEELEAKFPAK